MTGIENLTLAVAQPSDFQLLVTILLTLAASLCGIAVCLVALSHDRFPWKTHWRTVTATVAIALIAAVALVPIVGWWRAATAAHDKTLAALEEHYDLRLPDDEVSLSDDAMTTVTAIDQRADEVVTVTIGATDGRVTVYGEHTGTRAAEFRTAD